MIELLRNRRSIRKYKEEKLPQETVDTIVEALLRSPSSRGINPWEFVVVEDREVLKKLSMSKEHGSSFLSGAALGIVVCGDSTKSDTWIEDCSIASIIAQLTAVSLGLGTCWIQIRNRKHKDGRWAEEYIKEILGLEKHLSVESIIAIGYKDEVKSPVPKESLEYKKVRYIK
ncbi:MAG: nitroreductase family protein [Syntrophorhabdaceae bacterium]|nr:nitroreductase family protein [Syntrophorhabdaceae bacterium]